MKTEYIYVSMRHDGSCERLAGPKFEKANLTDLLAEGWRPIRETPFSQSDWILICLEREPEGQMGFGFGH